MNIRRVVTGHDANGRAIVASDEMVAPVTLEHTPWLEMHQLWGADTAPTYPDPGSPLSYKNFFPPVGGFRFIVIRQAPASERNAHQPVDSDAALAEVNEKLPGLNADNVERVDGLHRTESVDIFYIASGQIVLVLDDGAEVTLKAGDTIVQSGTFHHWRNDADEPCVMLGVMFGAKSAHSQGMETSRQP